MVTLEGHTGGAIPDGHTRGALAGGHPGGSSLLFMQSLCEQRSSPSLISGSSSVNELAQHLAAGAYTPTLALMSCVRTADGSCICVSSPPLFSPGVMG